MNVPDKVAEYLSAYDPSFRERVGNVTYDVARYLGLGGIANRMRNDVQGAVDFFPGVGDAVGLNEAYRDAQAGNYMGALGGIGTTAIGAIPGGGDLAAGALKAIFGGVSAANADKFALKLAKDMAEKNASKSDIWEKTGWFTGPDGNWRFEIDDSNAYYDAEALRELNELANLEARKFDPIKDTTTVSGLVGHKELFSAYPTVENIPVHFFPQDRMRGANAAYSPKLDRITLNDSLSDDQARSFMLHELQHAIQAREGFQSGGNLSQDSYNRLAGEVEARNVQYRKNMTKEERISIPPWETQDVPYSEQILKALGYE